MGSSEHDPALYEVQSGFDQEIERVKGLIGRVHDFRIRIEDELAKGQESQLRVDRRQSDESGMVYITLRSLDQWAVKEYGQPVLAPPLGARSDQRAEEEPDGRAEQELSSREAKRVLIALALLEDLIVESGPPKYKVGTEANRNALAQRMSQLAKNQGIEKQGVEKLRRLLADADKVRKEELSAKARRT
jgi:hypothetical protein